MAEDQNETRPAVSHDFFADRKWLNRITGFDESTTVLYKAYRVVFLLLMVYIQVSAVMACVLDPSKPVIVEALHFMLIALYAFSCIAIRVYTYRSLSNTRNFLNAGIYCYQDEEDDSALMKIKQSIPGEIRWKSNIFVYLIIFGALTNTTILFPLSQLLLLDPDDPSLHGVTNPYLPHLYYQPFDTRTPKGMIAGNLLGVAYNFYVYTVSAVAMCYYLSGVVQMKIHFRVLNYSIQNVQRRAYRIYSRIRKNTPSNKFRDVHEDETFQECVYMCFRSNVQHHQALLKLRSLFEPYSGLYSLAVFSLASMVYGCLLYLLSQVNPINVTVNLFLAFCAEQFTVIYICFFGEEVLTESEKVFHQLYDTSWFNYSKKLRQIVQIAMANTIKPTGVKALIFGVPASFETYGQVASAMYKVMNLVRQSDVV